MMPNLSLLAAPYDAVKTWWRLQMETFSALLALCAGNSPVTGEFPSQRPVTRSFDVFFDLRLSWVNNREAGDLRHHRAHYYAILMKIESHDCSLLSPVGLGVFEATMAR